MTQISLLLSKQIDGSLYVAVICCVARLVDIKDGGGGVEERDQFAYQLEIGGSILSHRGGPTLLTASDERKGLSLVLILSCPYFTRQILYGKLRFELSENERTVFSSCVAV